MSDSKSALATLAAQELVKKEDRMNWVQNLGSENWKRLPDNMKRALEFAEMLEICKIQAQLLVKIPHKGNSGEPDWYMSPEQALVHSMRCYNLGLDVFSGQVWFKPDTWTTTATLEGKQVLASQRPNIGTPAITEIKRAWVAGYVKPAALKSYDQEPGLRCTIQVGSGQVVYDCWFTEWTTNKVLWLSKPLHMLGVRAREKALGIALGVGSSDMPDEKEIESAEEIPELPQTITAKRVEFKPQATPEPQSVTNETDLQSILERSVEAIKNKK